MASLFSMPRPRGKRNEDNLFDMNGDIGMFDTSFQGVGRAPVDERFAGRNSAIIDDAAWDELTAEAQAELEKQRKAVNKENMPNFATRFAENYNSQLEGKGNVHDYSNSYIDETEGGDDDMTIRRAVTDATGLHMYPGQGVKGKPEDSIFMYEFDDSGATLADGWRDGEMPSTLGGILNHEELYQHYPELQDLPLTVEALGPRLMGSSGGVDRMWTRKDEAQLLDGRQGHHGPIYTRRNTTFKDLRSARRRRT